MSEFAADVDAVVDHRIGGDSFHQEQLKCRRDQQPAQSQIHFRQAMRAVAPNPMLEVGLMSETAKDDFVRLCPVALGQMGLVTRGK